MTIIKRLACHALTALILSTAAFGALSFVPPAGIGSLVLAQVTSAPTPPQTYFSGYTSPTGATIGVHAGDNLQSALDRARPGDEVVLDAGAAFSGNFTVGGATGSGWITVRTSNLAGIGPEGSRVGPSNAASMPRIVTPNSSAALSALSKTPTAMEAHNYRFIGIEFTAAADAMNLIKLGYGNETDSASLSHDFIIDRCYIHGSPSRTLRRGIMLNNARTAIVDSYVSDCHEVGADSQAICGWNGPGPFSIINNYLEASGENVMFGGADPAISGLIPSDIEFRRNHCFKPLTWKVDNPSYAGIPWSVKNIFELKNAQRVLIDGNVFENNWVDGQTGYAILLKCQNQDGGAPWSVTQDVQFTNNIVRHASSALNLLGRDPYNPSGQMKRVSINNNLFNDIGGVWGGEGTFLKMTEAVDVALDHNTVVQTGNAITAYGAPTVGFSLTNCIVNNNLYGVKGDGTASGSATLGAFFLSYAFIRNAVIGGAAQSYPTGNFFPALIADVGFTDSAHDNYRLLDTSPYRRLAFDGADLGVDTSKIGAADGGSGGSPSPGPTEVVLYTGDAPVRVGNWFVVPDSTAAGGARLANFDRGAAKLATALASPLDYFEMTFNATAGIPYRLWVRGRAESDSPYNDSVHVQFSGSVDAAGAPAFRIGSTNSTVINLEDYLNQGVHGWGWQDNGWGIGVLGPVIYFQNTGPQTMRIQIREDGFSIDQIVLSPQRYMLKSPGALKDDGVILAR